MMKTRRSELGITLPELMIGLVLVALMTAQAFTALHSQKRVYSSNERAVESQEDARLVLDLVAFDTRMGGLMVPQIVGISSGSGGANNPDTFCVSDTAYIDFVNLTSGERFLEQPQVTAVNSGGGTITLNSLDVDGLSAANDFWPANTVVPGIIISDGQSTFCGSITAINGNTLSVVPNPPLFADLTLVRAAPAVFYQVVAGAPPPAGGVQNFSLQRNGVTMSNTIEDFQVQFWVDTNSNGLIDAGEFPIDNLNNIGLANTTSSIRRAQISILSRSAQTDGGSVARMGTGIRPQLGDRNVAANPDTFRRRIFTTSVMPRNVPTIN